MPCFNAATGGEGMGIGRLGDADIIHKRKFRWTFAIEFCNHSKNVPASFVKTASRPSLTIEETDINFLNEKTWIPGKASWEAIDVTYYDVSASENIGLLSWLASVYDFTNDTCRWMNAKRQDYAGSGILRLLDGCGNIMEQWILNDMWPTSIKFGDLDYSSSEVCEIALTLRYSKVEYTSNCGGTIVRCGCTPCSNSSGRAGSAGATGSGAGTTGSLAGVSQ